MCLSVFTACLCTRFPSSLPFSHNDGGDDCSGDDDDSGVEDGDDDDVDDGDDDDAAHTWFFLSVQLLCRSASSRRSLFSYSLSSSTASIALLLVSLDGYRR